MVSQQTVEDQFLTWLVLQPTNIEQLVGECSRFRRECPDAPMPMVEWIAVHGEHAGIEQVVQDVTKYLASVVQRPTSAYTVPRAPLRGNGVPPSEVELLMSLLHGIANGHIPQPSALTTIPSPPQKQQQQRPSFSRALVSAISIVLTILTFSLILIMVNFGIRAVTGRDVPNELRIFWASRTIPDFALNENGEYLAWDNGKITFFSHDYACAPAFRSLGSDGTLLPPPLKWPEQDAKQLLVSEYVGCMPLEDRITYGYWGDSPWGVMIVVDKEWMEDHDLVAADKAESAPLWVEYARFGITKKGFQAGTRNLEQQGGAVGITGEDRITPTLVPMAPTVAQQQVAPTPVYQAPAPPVVAPPVYQPQPEPSPVPVENPAEPGLLPVVPTQRPMAPHIEPTTPPATPVFATQTPMPAPTTDLVEAARVMHAAQTAQAARNPGHLQAPQSTPNDVVNPLPCTGCHGTP
jgi:hypothetical protein